MLIVWNESLRAKIKDKEQISFKLLDKEDNQAKIFIHDTTTSEFRMTAGKKRFYVNDSNFEPLGILEFEFETMNFVNREESTKN